MTVDSTQNGSDDGQQLFDIAGQKFTGGRESIRVRGGEGRPPFPEPVDEVVPLSLLNHVDREGYQRKLRLPRVEEMARNWDIVLADYILVSRRADGTLWVVDGQHRSAAAQLAGETDLLARVFEGLTVEQEADLFYTHSTSRRNISSLEKFHAGVRAGYTDLVEIQEVVHRAGGEINHSFSYFGGINSPETLMKVHRYGGPTLLRAAVETTLAGFGELKGPSAEGSTIAAVAFTLGLHANEIDRDHLVRRMQKVGAEAIKGDAKHFEAAKQTRDTARYHALVAAYNWRIGEDRKLTPERPVLTKLAPRTCTVKGCERKHHARTLCREHYEEWFDGARRQVMARAEAA